MAERFKVHQLTGINVWVVWDTQGDAPVGELFTDLSEVEKAVAKLNSSPQPAYDDSLPPMGIYARISDDSEEKGEGVFRQLQDGSKLSKTTKARIKDYYVDNDKSASTRTKTIRPDYDRMLTDARSKKITLIGAYSNGRVTRRPLELEDLIKLYEEHKTVIHTVVSGQDDLSTADGRMVARIKASVDAAEVERLAERVTRQKKMRAEQGKPQNGRWRTYGFTKKDNIPIEEELLRVGEAFRRRATGESLTSIANNYFKKNGYKTSTDRDWTAGILDTTLKNPIYAGLRRYNGEIIGPVAIDHVEGVFPCVSEEVFNLVQSEIVKDAKGTNARTHLGSGFLICQKCLTRMKGNNYTKNYRCSITYGGCGKVSVRIKEADRWLLWAAIEKYFEAPRPKKKQAKKRDLVAELAVVEAEITRIQEGYQAEIYTLREAQPLLKVQREKKKEIEKEQLKQLPERNPNNRVTEIMDVYKLDVSEKRAFIAKYVEHIVVAPTGPKKGSHNFHPERLEIHYVDGTIEIAKHEVHPEDVYGPEVVYGDAPMPDEDPSDG